MNNIVNRKEIIKKLKQVRIVDDRKKIVVKEKDYSNNPLSPVETVYQLFYTDYSGNRIKCTYFGEVLGFQG